MAPRLYLWQYYDQNPDDLSEDELIKTASDERDNGLIDGTEAQQELDLLKFEPQIIDSLAYLEDDDLKDLVIVDEGYEDESDM